MNSRINFHSESIDVDESMDSTSTDSLKNEEIQVNDNDSIVDSEQLLQTSLSMDTINLYQQNKVSYVTMRGVTVISLLIDGKERLCLAQISNTMLKNYSYNEIHNRRVALGINCIQCTPVQLEILRRTGAMPISSRRCGMITKREAERLVKSFLEDNKPPSLPENFSFSVYHKCGWGSRGIFYPSRYSSSRAKCIRCYYCNLFYSPNKFIFHAHNLPDSKYVQPDTANFNSWRRHLLLVNPKNDEHLANAWEDVKAIFNGGTRKRGSHQSSISRPSSTRSNSSDMRETIDDTSEKEPKSVDNDLTPVKLPKFNPNIDIEKEQVLSHLIKRVAHCSPKQHEQLENEIENDTTNKTNLQNIRNVFPPNKEFTAEPQFNNQSSLYPLTLSQLMAVVAASSSSNYSYFPMVDSRSNYYPQNTNMLPYWNHLNILEHQMKIQNSTQTQYISSENYENSFIKGSLQQQSPDSLKRLLISGETCDDENTSKISSKRLKISHKHLTSFKPFAIENNCFQGENKI